MFRKIDSKSLLLALQSPALRLLKLSPKVITLPSLIVYLVNRCNYHCVMCITNDLNREPLEKMELSLLENLLDQAAALPFKPLIHFSGYGEPLVYPNFSEVARLCREKNLHWGLTTNGYLLDKYSEEIVHGNCRGINISIHGSPDIHNRIVKVPDAFEKAMIGIQTLDRAKQSNHASNPPIAINCVISRQNIRQLPDVFQTFKTLPINSVTFQHLIFSEADMEMQNDFMIQAPEDLQALYELKKMVESDKSDIRVRFFPSLKDEQIKPYYTNKDYPSDNTCLLPWISTRVYPSGNVYLCENFYGSLKDTPLKKIMNSDAARRFRKQVSQKAFRSDMCFRCCHRQYL